MMYPFEEFPHRLALLSVDTGGEAVGGGGGDSGPAAPPEGGAPSTGAPPSPEPGGVSEGAADTSAPFSLSDDVMFASDLDEVEIPEIAEPAQPPEPQPAAQPPAPQQPAQPPPPTAKPAQQPAAQAQSQQPAAEGTGPSRVPSAPELLQMVMQNRDTIVGELASKRFAMTPAEQEELETNAVGAVSKMAARVYFDAYTSAMHYMNQQIPSMITSHIAESRKDTEAEDAFYSAWPGIDKAKHASDVLGFARAYWSMNPKGSLQEAIKFAGSAVSAKHGLQGAGKPATPARTSAPARRPAPFAPAAGGRTTSTVPVENNAWDGLGMTFDE